MSTKNTDPNALITLGDFSSHFAQTVDGFIALSDDAKEFVLDGLTLPTPTPTPVPMTSTEISALLKADPNIVYAQDMAGNAIGYILP